MLVLSRKVGEQIVIGDNITIVVNKVAGNRISLGIQAPRDVRIVRGELKEAVTSFDDEEVVSLRITPADDLAQSLCDVVYHCR
jgi:carbon storage regulator CsrA